MMTVTGEVTPFVNKYVSKKVAVILAKARISAREIPGSKRIWCHREDCIDMTINAWSFRGAKTPKLSGEAG